MLKRWMCFSELCQKGPETSENLRLQEIVTTYREPSAGQLVVVVVDGGAESEPPHTGPGGWVQETAVSANGHQQITEDQQTQHHVIDLPSSFTPPPHITEKSQQHFAFLP